MLVSSWMVTTFAADSIVTWDFRLPTAGRMSARIAEVAKLLNDVGIVAIAAFISPYREIREMARQIIRPKHFIEIHVATRLEVCEERDPKGLYVKARAGLIADFTGVSAPYETPRSPDLTVDAGRLSVGESLTMIMFALERRLKRVARKL